MAYVVTEHCIGTLNQDCLTECPADCFYFVPGALFRRGVGFLRPGMLMINPDECIDCGACETACPVEAIYEDRSVPEGSEQFTRLNAEITRAMTAEQKERERRRRRAED